MPESRRWHGTAKSASVQAEQLQVSLDHQICEIDIVDAAKTFLFAQNLVDRPCQLTMFAMTRLS